MDLSNVSSEDLQAMKSGDLSKVSKEGLLELKNQQQGGFTKGGATQPIPSNVVNEKPLEQVPGPITNLLTLGIGGTSEATAGLPMLGKVAKNIIDTPANTINAIKNIPEVVTSLGKGVKSVASEGISKLQSLADSIIGQGEKGASISAEQMTAPSRQVISETGTALKSASNPTPELLATQERQAALGSKFGEKQQQLIDMKKEAGQAIGMVEKSAGLEFKTLPDNFQKMLRDKELLGSKANTMARLADKGPEFISQNLDPMTIQINRKLAQEALKMPGLDDLTRVQLARANSTFGSALGEQIPELKDKLSAFKQIDQALKDLPRAKKAEGDILRLSIRRQMNEIRTNKMNLQDKMTMAKEAFDNVSKNAETLIQRGKQRDINRSILTKAAIGLSGAGYAAKKLGL